MDSARDSAATAEALSSTVTPVADSITPAATIAAPAETDAALSAPYIDRAALAREIAAGGAPAEVLLLPAGTIRTRDHDGRAPWHNPDGDAVVQATAALSLPLPVDYDHQSQRAAANGQPAPAAGWITRTFARGGAVWGAVEWTERAAAMIAAREYRFISPVFDFTRATRVVKRIVGAGLTNDPAFYMRAIAAAQTERGTMDELLTRLRKALGLADDADEAAVVDTAATVERAKIYPRPCQGTDYDRRRTHSPRPRLNTTSAGPARVRRCGLGSAARRRARGG